MQGRILSNATLMSVKTDRRTQTRKRPLSLVYVELPPSNGGMLRDLNEHGFSLRSMMPLQPSEKLAFSISLDNGVRIDGDAIVVRLEDKGHVAALEFAGLAAHARDQIRRWLEKFEEPLAREAGAPKPPATAPSTLEELRQEARAAIAGPPPSAEPVAPPVEAVVASAPPAPEPPPDLTQPQQPPQPEPAPPSAPPVVATEPKIEPAPPMPILVQRQSEVAEASPLPQIQLPFQPVPEPAPMPPLDTPPEQPSEAEELPLPQFLRQPENAAPPPPAPKLPPLLKLSSVRPGLPPEPPKEPVFRAAHPPAAEPHPLEPPPGRNPVPLSEILIQPPSVTATHSPAPAPSAPRRTVPPPLEPLSAWESETDATSPGWMESFTLGRAVGIMVILTLIVGGVVYHREVGHVLIWLGGQIAGEEPQETSQITRPPVLPLGVTPQSTAAPANPGQASASSQQDSASPENKTAEPSSSETSGVPHAEAGRVPETAPADSSSGNGQEEYQRAMQILKTPSRRAELPEAVRLLWLAVRKNHVGAEITLAELYHQGRGVRKSCDQTRVLLSAAARRGSPDARKRLQEFVREGCRD